MKRWVQLYESPSGKFVAQIRVYFPDGQPPKWVSFDDEEYYHAGGNRYEEVPF